MTDVFNRISELDARLHFCEDLAASGPADRTQRPGAGPLSGKVIGIKSNISVADQAWTAGIRARAGTIATSDAPIASCLRDAGATLLSRLAMDEGALGAATDNPHFGRCENPAMPGHTAGGSSGGPAAAVACGAVDAALGTDTMGSVRIPAAYCGVYGLKFGSDTVDMSGIVPLATGLDSVGLLASTPSMLAQVFDVLAQQRAQDNITGWFCIEDTSMPDCTSDVRHGYQMAQRSLRNLLGPPKVALTMDLTDVRNDAFLLTEAEAAVNLCSQAGLSAGLQKLIDYGRGLSPEKLASIRGRLATASTNLRAALGQDRVLLMPTVAAPAFAHGARAPVGQADFTALANIADLPALAIPVRAGDTPVSFQLVGPPGSERALLALATRL